MRVDGSDLRQITPWGLHGADADWSPDGKQIVFSSQPTRIGDIGEPCHGLPAGCLDFIRDGLRLMRALRGNVSGLCLPTYMLDIPGGHGKIPLAGDYVHERDDGTYDVVNHRGERFEYVEPGDLRLSPGTVLDDTDHHPLKVTRDLAADRGT